MRLCIDLDGTICYTKKDNQKYSEVKPKNGAIDVLKQLKREGHYIIIDTARHMKTCNHNVGQVIAKQGKTLFEWLDKWEIPYDEVHFGKPLADVYIDDKGLEFNNWEQINTELKKIK
jgi:capsule biosynthesis phosphatase